MLLHRSMTTRSKSSAREWTAAQKNESWQRISTRKGICNHVNATTVQHFHICMLLHRSMTTSSKSSARELTVARRKLKLAALKLAANQHEKSNLQSRDCCNCSICSHLLRACYFTARWRLSAYELKSTSDYTEDLWNKIEFWLHRGYKRLWAKSDLRLHQGFTR